MKWARTVLNVCNVGAKKVKKGFFYFLFPLHTGSEFYEISADQSKQNNNYKVVSSSTKICICDNFVV
jgi:hypothetical protein